MTPLLETPLSETPLSETPLPAALLTRREALLRLSGLVGGAAFVGQSAILAGCATQNAMRASGAEFSRADIGWFAEVADTILPPTATPGAKAAGVGDFIAVMVRDTYETGEQETFRAGMEMLEVACLAATGVGFVDADPTARTALLERIDREQFEYMQRRGAGEPVHYFRMLKELTLMGYFTSEIGYTQAMRYREAPGRFDACVPYEPGETIWAPHA